MPNFTFELDLDMAVSGVAAARATNSRRFMITKMVASWDFTAIWSSFPPILIAP